MSNLIHRRNDACIRTQITVTDFAKIYAYIKDRAQLNDAFDPVRAYMEINRDYMTPILWAMAVNLVQLRKNNKGPDDLPVCSGAAPDLICFHKPVSACEYLSRTVCCIASCGLLCDESRFKAAYALLDSKEDETVLIESQPVPRASNLVEIIQTLSSTLTDLDMGPLCLHDSDTSYALYAFFLYMYAPWSIDDNFTLNPIIANSFLGTSKIYQ